AKRTSSGFSARSSPGLIEPVAQRIESETFDFPEPFGPTTTATPGSRRTSTGSTKDLNPRSLMAFRCTRGQATERLGRRQGQESFFRRGLLRILLGAPDTGSEHLRVDDRGGREGAVVRRPFDLQGRVGDGATGPCELLLELRLVVDVARQRV